jgi:YbbR domain-containing protein
MSRIRALRSTVSRRWRISPTLAIRAGNRLRDLVRHNLGLKFASLFIAVLLWMAVASAPKAEVSFDVPIEFHNVPEGIELTTAEVPRAQVRVRGSDQMVRQLSPAELHVALDLQPLRDAQPGDHTFELTPAEIRLPGSLEVVQITPTSLKINFDKRATKMVEVRPRVVGNFPPGFRITSVVVEPQQLEIVGAESRLRDIESATTDPIDASGVMGRQVFLATPHVVDAYVRFSRTAQVRVAVTTERTR